LGFIGCEGVDVDAEDFDDFIGEPLFQNFQCLVVWAERFVSTSIGQDSNIAYYATFKLDIVSIEVEMWDYT